MYRIHSRQFAFFVSKKKLFASARRYQYKKKKCFSDRWSALNSIPIRLPSCYFQRDIPKNTLYTQNRRVSIPMSFYFWMLLSDRWSWHREDLVAVWNRSKTCWLPWVMLWLQPTSTSVIDVVHHFSTYWVHALGQCSTFDMPIIRPAIIWCCLTRLRHGYDVAHSTGSMLRTFVKRQTIDYSE